MISITSIELPSKRGDTSNSIRIMVSLYQMICFLPVEIAISRSQQITRPFLYLFELLDSSASVFAKYALGLSIYPAKNVHRKSLKSYWLLKGDLGNRLISLRCNTESQPLGRRVVIKYSNHDQKRTLDLAGNVLSACSNDVSLIFLSTAWTAPCSFRWTHPTPLQ